MLIIALMVPVTEIPVVTLSVARSVVRLNPVAALIVDRMAVNEKPVICRNFPLVDVSSLVSPLPPMEDSGVE